MAPSHRAAASRTTSARRRLRRRARASRTSAARKRVCYERTKHKSLPLCRHPVPGGVHQRQLVRSGLRVQSADEFVLPRKRRTQEEARDQALIIGLSYRNLSAIAFGLCVAQRAQLYTTHLATARVQPFTHRAFDSEIVTVSNSQSLHRL